MRKHFKVILLVAILFAVALTAFSTNVFGASGNWRAAAASVEPKRQSGQRPIRAGGLN